MKIQVGCGGDVYGTIEESADGQLEIDPQPGAAEILGQYVDHYGESLALEGADPATITPRMILDAMLDRMNGYTGAKVIEE